MSYIDETGLAEVTTKLKTYIDNKAGGGDTPPTTIAELYSKSDQLYEEVNDKVDQLYEDAILDSYNNPVPTSIIYTNQPVTLYTPNADCTHYLIFHNDNNKFGIIWFNYSESRLLTHDSGVSGGISASCLTFSYVQNHSVVQFSSIGYNLTLYVSQDRYDTVDQAIAAIQSDQTTYIISPTYSWQNSYQGLSTYSNTKYSMLVSINNNTSLPLTFYELAKLSDNETIEVIV